MKKYKISEVCDVYDCLHITPEYEKNGLPMVRVSEINNDFLDLSYSVKVSKDIYQKYISNYKPQKGDIILARVGAFLGEFAYVDTDKDFCIGQNTTIIHPKDNCLSKYIFYNLISPIIQTKIQRTAAGSAYKNFGVESLKNLEIDFFKDEKTCEKIGDVLYKIDKKIKNNNKINDNLEELAFSIFLFNFGNKKDNGTIGNIVKENSKSSVKVGEAKDIKGDFPFFTSGESILEWNDYLVDGRNLYLNTGGNADVKFYVGKAMYSTDTWCITTINNYSDYLYLYFKSIKSALDKKFFHGSGLKHLQKPLLKNEKIYIPNNEEIRKFNEKVQPMFDTISANENENKRLNSLKEFLLPLLMNGQINVDDIDI